MKTLFCLALLLFAVHAGAATLCATNSSELQAALDTAKNNNQDDVIRLQTGTYSAPTGGFTFDTSNSDNFNITISGGWTNFQGTPCGRRQSYDPFDTTLNGNGTSRVMLIYPNTDTNVDIQYLGFVGGNTVNSPSTQRGAGLYVAGLISYLGTVTIENDLFYSNVSGNFGGGLTVSAGTGLVVRNNLFIDNQANCTDGAASLTYNGSNTAYVVSNTVALNFVGADCSGSSTPPDGGLRFGGTAPVLMVNNIFWDNVNFDLMLQDSNVQLVANDYHTLHGVPASNSGNNFDMDPLFAMSNPIDVRLGNHSPLIDAGVEPRQSSGWQLAAYDLDGLTRIIGRSVDLGAYENADEIFFNRFE